MREKEQDRPPIKTDQPARPTRRPSYSPISPTQTYIELTLPIQPKDLIDPSLETTICLWRAWPLDWSMVRQGMALQYLTSSLDEVPSNESAEKDKKLYKANQGQASRLMRLMDIDSHWKNISLLDRSITEGITSPMEIVKKNKDACRVENIREKVKEAIKCNEEATTQFELGQYPRALTTYLRGLAVLCPWSSDDSIMTFDLARSAGLSDIEQQILLNIVRAALAWSFLLPHDSQTKHLCPTFIDSTLQAFEFFPYTTYEGMIQLSDQYFSPERKRLFEVRRRSVREWGKQPPEEWPKRVLC
ncbi:hypothetical protein I302_106032 [Kwoniella bestiolae CBS 10118]|uniref:Uncharacterized protein n=1 Tax=Kwoniella bestiolae CBS 10118 TaxID=1296100 RepID=A0A1B9G2U8_9TREE|nr:hypothetical protein I302_05156 [Kwoniella bestiolae CBS 10118]OCF25340.1 hypothetical protein I302_05156 [Kwoniella bestiolae CBS 10118]